MPSVSASPGSGPIYGTGTSDYSKNQNVTKEFKDPGSYSVSFKNGTPTFKNKTLGYGYAGDQQLNAYVDALKKSAAPKNTLFGAINSYGLNSPDNQLNFAQNKLGFYSMLKNNPNLSRNMSNPSVYSKLLKAIMSMTGGGGFGGNGLLGPIAFK